MDKTDYIKKMEDLLTDTSTYTPQSEQQAKEESRRFNTDVRKILKRTNKGKHLLHLLEEDPKTPTIRGIPKTHKAGIPMRPITNGIGSAPHKLAKILAKPLTSALGTFSDTHIRNSTDLIQKLQTTDFTNKKLISLDVIALYTHTSLADAISAIQKVIDNIDETTLPINKRDYKQLVEKCLKCAFCTFNGKTYRQHDGLPMGSPLSAIAACLAMEILEQSNYKQFLPDGTTWFRPPKVEETSNISTEDISSKDQRPRGSSGNRIIFKQEPQFEELGSRGP
ncbi:uncharacterized protein LOC143026103 [Oratosquilla oratoria]|uniref:uncharacterized protein LOC143026103 n=1 Tax=Oratosquilla oratoria TaxID=337810 RepID=UPI003F773DFA